MSRFTEIEKALINAVLSIDNVTPMGMPGVELPDSAKPAEGMWLQLYNMRSSSRPVTLGDQGEDNHSGYLQIDINFPKGYGSGDVLEKADEFADFFTAGKPLVYNTREVKVKSCSLSPGRYVGGYYRVSLTIVYYARSTRNT